MKLFDRFKRKKKTPGPAPIKQGLPQDLERFRVSRGPGPRPEPIQRYPAPQEMPPRPGLPAVEAPAPIETPKSESRVMDKEDMILQKLETIDARLRLIEEKLR